MRWSGNLSVLADLCRGEPVTIAAEGNGFRSATIVGFLEALANANVFGNAYVGVSGSAGPIAAHLSGNSDATFDVYAKLAREGCFEWKWGLAWPLGISRTITFKQEALLREIEQRLDTRSLAQSSSHFGVTVLEYETGEGKILNGKVDVLQKIAATTAIPGLCKPITIDGTKYVDGISLAIDPSIRPFWRRKIIVLRSRCKWWWEDTFYGYIVRYNLSALPLPLVEAVATADIRFDMEMRKLTTCAGIQCLEIGPDESDPFIWPWCHDVAQLRELRDRAREFLTRLIDTHGSYAPKGV